MEKQAFIEKYHKYLIAVASVIIVVVGSIFFLKQENKEQADAEMLFSTEPLIDSSEGADSGERPIGYADIKGAVKQPGMYALKTNMRILDLIESAGGFLNDADQKQVNLAQIVEDQMVVYVPVVGEEIEEGTVRGDAQVGGAKEAAEDKVNINTADANQLQNLTGIGAKKAEEIIRYREANGSFKSIEELKEVSGIGEKTFDSLKDSITI